MYLVVSRWKANPGKETQFEENGAKVGALLRKLPGVVMVEEFADEGQYVSVHGYKDESTYRKLIDDPNGQFNQALKQYKVEEYGKWISSERGTTIKL